MIRGFRSIVVPAALLALAGLFAGDALAEVSPGWGRWWLPPDRSTHGWAIDQLFNWIFWITMVTFVLVEVTLVVFLIKYRRRPDRKKAVYTHGNTRLEMLWTLAPAVILALLAIFSKRVWDQYHFESAADAEDRNPARVLVVGEQFKWNVVYPGPDGKLGRYLIYPKPTDLKWPDGKKFQGVAGPAYLPFDKAVRAINSYIGQTKNRLGKDFTDPDGKDDDYEKALARELYIPVDRPIEIHLSSRDVIHDFFLPNYRVKLDAVPGMRGIVRFTATKTSAQREQETLREYTVAELEQMLPQAEFRELTVVVNENTPAAQPYKVRDKIRYWRYVDADGKTIIADGRTFGSPQDAKSRLDTLEKLKAAGVEKVTAYVPGYWDLVCEELCGLGHYTMQGRVVVLSQDEYAKRFEGGTKTEVPEDATAAAQ